MGLNVRESIDCNWKVVMDAFQECYHLHSVHPELVSFVDMTKERFSNVGYHAACTVPFGEPGKTGSTPVHDVEKIRGLPPSGRSGAPNSPRSRRATISRTSWLASRITIKWSASSSACETAR